ncbi:MAG TPA: NAD-binding protein [Mycobacterium sp.]|uniref:NAD-binding protein n=1 Tax=Mycolicibacterium sp. TaxID=2320850 RepID=UPI0025E42A42|nr:NAD-binding protein [Mycolicibacterium sp.]HPX38126.1 NAD-binding protein [Mycobacterium sp.]
MLHLWARRRAAQRTPIDIPSTVPTTEVIFLIMRRMRAPLIFVIVTFSFCTAGMMFIPGVDSQGNPHRLSIFDAFYQMTITLTTVGFTEAPYPFSIPQRMWMSLSIFLLVISWAYAIGVFLSLVQSSAFQSAVAAQQFRRQVRRLVEPFVIVGGYGNAGKLVGVDLDEHYRRFVVIDHRQESVQSVVSEELSFDVPAVQGDCAEPAVLGMAGLGSPHCEGVLALTSDDDTNLAVVMAASLLRPDLPVLGRCAHRRTRNRMEHFAPGSAINADDRFGDYLAQSIHQPVSYQLLRWLMDNDQERLLPARRDLADRRWMVCAEGEFGETIVSDLAAIGLNVELVDPAGDEPDVSGSVAFVAGTDNDTVNIAMAEHTRHINPDAYLVVRQQTNAKKILLETLQIESVYIATEVIAREVLARILTPEFWSFVEYVLTRDDQWATEVRDHLEQRCGQRTPERDILTLSEERAPAIADWLRRGNTLTLGTLMLQPDDRDTTLPLAALVLFRDGEPQFMPPEDTPLALDDQVLIVGKPAGLSEVREVCFYPSTVEYLATGHEVPLTWAWSKLTTRRRSRTK